jgi:hypothetical protein
LRIESILPLVAVPDKDHDGSMFSVYCPRHAARVLLSPRNIRNVVKRTGGFELHWRCTCDEEGVARATRWSA